MRKLKSAFYVGSKGSSHDDMVDAVSYAWQSLKIKKANMFVRMWRWIKFKLIKTH